MKDFPATKILTTLEGDDLLPGILFRSARKTCDQDVEFIQRHSDCVVSLERRQAIQKGIDEAIQKFNLPIDIVETHPQYGGLLQCAVGAHHAGQLLVWRLLLEELMSKGLLRLMIATGTVAAGVDFPARSVVITAHSKRGNDGFNVLTASEFQQMSGRAGRRGKDAVGVVVIAPGGFNDARVISDVLKRPPEPLKSAYFAAPSTVLNLLRYRTVNELWFTVRKSFAAFLDKRQADKIRKEVATEEQNISSQPELKDIALKKAEKRLRRRLTEADEIEHKQEASLTASVDGLSKLGFIDNGVLSDKGKWAAHLCTTYVLEISEIIDSGLLDEVTLEQLVGVIAAISSDSHRPYLSLRKNPIPKATFKRLETIIERVSGAYKHQGGTDPQVNPDAALTALTWIEADDWMTFSALLRLGGIAEGDVSRLLTQTADNLNQIARLEDTHEHLALLASEARKRILRPPLTEL